MFTPLIRLSALGAAFLMSLPALAAHSSATAGAAIASASSAHPGGGGNVGGGHGGAMGAHGAAMSTHLGGAGHPLHAATAHAVTTRATESKHPLVNLDASKKPGHGPAPVHASHIFLHRGATWSAPAWASTCIRTFTPPDQGAWSDCNRPVKTPSAPHT